DAFLSVSGPTVVAAPEILARRAPIQARIAARIATNLATVQRFREGTWNLLPREGGGYGMLRVPRVDSDEAVALQLLRRHGVVVHPRAFFGCPSHQAFLVLSLVTEPDVFSAGFRCIHESFVGETNE